MRKILEIYRRERLNRLARKMQKGSAEAAEEIYNYFADKLFGFLLNRLGNKATAEDLSQNIFLKLVAKIELFNPELGSFSAWFWQLARNTLIDHYRNSENKNVDFSEIEEAALEKISAAEAADPEINFEVKQVMDFVKTLPQEEQEIFELRFIAQLSFREMSHVLNKNENSLRVYALRLRKKIQEGVKR